MERGCASHRELYRFMCFTISFTVCNLFLDFPSIPRELKWFYRHQSTVQPFDSSIRLLCSVRRFGVSFPVTCVKMCCRLNRLNASSRGSQPQRPKNNGRCSRTATARPHGIQFVDSFFPINSYSLASGALGSCAWDRANECIGCESGVFYHCEREL